MRKLTSTGTSGGVGANVYNDNTVNSPHYPAFLSVTSGPMDSAYVSSTKLNFNPSTGTLSSTLFSSLSDISQKTNVTPVINALDVISKIKAVNFNWIDSNKLSIGIIAQQLEEILPELVELNPATNLKSINYDGLIGILIAGIQELLSVKGS